MNTDPAAGVPYCRAVAAAESKRACYSIVGRQAVGLVNGQARREDACGRAGPAFVDVCLGRAGNDIGAATVTARPVAGSR